MALAHALDSLRRRDDSRDVSARKSELLNLVDGLLSSEIRLLQQRLAHFIFICDFIPQLPQEILLIITNFLDVVDLVNVRRVSRRWKQSWTQIPICNKLMKENFRCIFEKEYSLLPEESDLRSRMLVAVTKRFLATQMGNYHTLKIRRYYSSYPGRDSSSTLDCKHERGRVAWAIKDSVIVTNLCSGVVEKYMSPERADVKSWSLSHKVLVVRGLKTFLHAWDLDTGQVFSVRLPNVPKANGLFTTHDRHVGVMTARNEIMIWTVGGALCQLREASLLLSSNNRRDGVSLIFHPSSTDTVLLLSVTHSEYDGVNFKARWTAQKYIKSQGVYELKNTFELDIPLQHPVSFPNEPVPSSRAPPTADQYLTDCQPDEMLWLSPRKLDENGTYIIGSLPNPVDSIWRKLGCEHESVKCIANQCSKIREVDLPMYITLNVYKDRLRPRCFLIHGRRGLDCTCMVSNPFEDILAEQDDRYEGTLDNIESDGTTVIFRSDHYIVMDFDDRVKKLSGD